MDATQIDQSVSKHLAVLLNLGRELVARRPERQSLAGLIEHHHRLKIAEIARHNRSYAEAFDAASAHLVIDMADDIRKRGVGVILEDRPGWPTIATGDPSA